MLDDMGIKWKDVSSHCKFEEILIYRTHFEHKGRHISVIIGRGTYGGDKGLLEMRDGQDEPEGYLTAEDIIKILKGERE